VARTLPLVLIVLLATPALAQPVDGSRALLCATQTVVECDSLGNCHRITSEAADLPPFVTVDVPRRLVHGGTDGRQAQIREASRVGDLLVLQGADGGRGWSMIVEPSGVLVASVVDERVAFNIFGRCIVR
jgi:hypothetical protein